ncbi:MAG: alpha/beta hydrolase [Bacteroidetes bacterium]|nr:alpha/beta hydrolase [Bacteroidota bacterium]
MTKKIFFCAFLVFCQNFLLSGQVKVIFKTTKIPASKDADIHLFLAGDFNGWNPADNASEMLPDNAGGYSVTKSLPAGSYNFKITRGSWEKVESTATGGMTGNRSAGITQDTTITMTVAGWQDNFPKPEKKHTASANVHIMAEQFDIPQLGRQRRVWIYLPPDYATSGKKYPVIYMHDGQNLFDDYTSGYGEWGVDEIMDKMPAKDQCIIVGVDHGGQYRISEYDPYDTKYGKGQGDAYVDFLVKNLKPYIDLHYRTKKDPQHTTVAGSSMGGLISLYALLKYPDVFGNAGVFSPAFWLSPDLFRYAEKARLKKYSRMYFVCGGAEGDTMVPDMEKMAGIIRAKGVSAQNSPELVVKGAKHNEKQWNGDFPAFYSWLSARSESPHKSGSPKE